MGKFKMSLSWINSNNLDDLINSSELIDDGVSSPFTDGLPLRAPRRTLELLD
jgi:hypothetical protein